MMQNTFRTNVNDLRPSIQSIDSRFSQNFLLVWLDAYINENNKDFRHSLSQLRTIVRSLKTFTDADQCIEYFKSIGKEKVFLIVSGSLGQTNVPRLHDMHQLDSIFVFCRDVPRHQHWANKWSKVQLVTTSIHDICDRLKTVARQCDHQALPIAFVPCRTSTSAMNHEHPDQLDPQFLYSFLFKEIVLEINYNNRQSMGTLMTYCREKKISDSQLEYFQKEFEEHSPVWWYSSEIFLYSLLNKALYSFDLPVMNKLGFFIHHLHRQLDRLHNEQSRQYTKEFVVYRGQGFTSEQFERLKQSQGGLLSFNNFLSTSKIEQVALDFIKMSLNKYKNNIGVLFSMTIDPRQASASNSPFASIDKYSAIPQEEEILFSMHSIFRIQQVRQSKKDPRVWDVQLCLSDASDPDIVALIKHMRKEISGSGWYRMGLLMLTLHQKDEAEKIFEKILKTSSNDREKAKSYQSLAKVKLLQEKHVDMITNSEKALEINRKIYSEEHRDIATSYHDIGEAYRFLGNLMKSLEYHERAHRISEKVLKSDDLDLATSYEVTGAIYQTIGNHFKALEYIQTAIRISEKVLPANHPKLAWSYTNIAVVYDVIGQPFRAMEYLEKALRINERALPPDHPQLGGSYLDTGKACAALSKFSEALAYYQKAEDIYQVSLHANHPEYARLYGSIGELYGKTGEYSKSVQFYKKALHILQKVFPPSHPMIQEATQAIAFFQSLQKGPPGFLAPKKL